MARLISLCFLIVFIALSSCNMNESKKTVSYNLKCSYYSKLYEKPINLKVVDSANSINMFFEYKRNGKGVERQRTFKFIKDGYYEIKLNKHFDDDIVDSIYTLALTKKDTVFNYEFDTEKYPPSLPKGFDDWKYSIKSIGKDIFSLTKNHLRDSTFKEEFLYDKNYKIVGVNIYQASDTLMFTDN